jgi:tRNA pseudouridine38-40 synthase
MTRRLKLTIAYDGTNYAGWQRQPDKPTVQQEIEQAFRDYTGQSVSVVASGRTDSGVHAIGQVASCDFTLGHTTEVIQRAVNFRLPLDIRILQVAEVPESFHAISSAVKKRYRYQIDDAEVGEIFARKYVWHIPKRLDETAMSAAAEFLVGTHNFASFEAAGAPRRSTIRTIYALDVSTRSTAPRIWVEVTANGFLYNMVRIICGSLVWVGKGKADPQWMEAALHAKKRELAGPTAPPQGLFLDRVWYD